MKLPTLSMRISRVLICFVFILVTTRGFCFPADVTSLSNREYFPAAQKAISQAKKSILVVMYLISFNKEDKSSKVFQLVDELVRAKLRGVEVKVILDYQSGSGFPTGQENYAAFSFLKDKGIQVYFDGAVVYTHAKAIVIDKRIVISGSHNWSDAALERNNETSFLIDSPKLAKQLLDEFSQIKLSRSGLKEGAGISIPYWAMAKDGIILDMLHRHDEQCLDIWLLLLKDFDGNPAGLVNTNYEVLAEGLGMLKDIKHPFYRRDINELLGHLNRLYKLVEIDIRLNQPVKVEAIKKTGRRKF